MDKVLIDRDLLQELLDNYETSLETDEYNGFRILNSERELVIKVKELLNNK